jgi:putative PIN family toxin of toxin-antitoxin system
MVAMEAPPRGGLPDETAGAESSGSAPVFSVAAIRRVVFDTNVLVSLFVFKDSRFAPLRSRLASGAWLALTNDACFGEFRRVLAYPMFKLDDDAQRAAMMAYDAFVIRHSAPPAPDIADLPRCRDRDDQKFLELARDAGADWLISADKDLLRLARRDKLRGLFCILTPEAAMQFAR